MEGYKYKSASSLIGDFYEAVTNKDRKSINIALDYLENLIGHGEIDSSEIKNYFNEIFIGRTAYNTLLSVNDYPVESIIRELIQNAFDCYYDTKEIKLAINFKENGLISIAYNEKGFSLEQFLYYLSFGKNNTDNNREGRFGVGAKSVFGNVEWLSLRSNNISFRIDNNDGVLKIEDLNLKRPIFSGTEIVIKVSTERYEKIKDNLSDLTAKKGDYINIVELCFAFNKKKILNNMVDNNETSDRSFNIAVLENSRLVSAYKIFKYKNTAADIEVIRFTYNNKNVVDFICYEQYGFTYLIPFAVSNVYREKVIKVLGDKYNYFSTYELTGLFKSESEAVKTEKLSTFFVSVPNHYITSFRTGIRHDSEYDVSMKVESGILKLISDYSKYFVLLIGMMSGSEELAIMRPDSYAFEFMKNFMLTSTLAKGLKHKFQNYISVRFIGENDAVPYTKLIKTAFKSLTTGISYELHESGEAYSRYIENEMFIMQSLITDTAGKTLYASYSWNNPDGSYGGTVYRYEFYRENKTFVIDSRMGSNIRVYKDYNLYYYFKYLTEYMIEQRLGGAELKNENDFTAIIELFDDRYHENYKISLRSFELCFSSGEEEYLIEISKMKISNIVMLMDTIAVHQNRFDSYSVFGETEKMFMSIFANERDIVDFLTDIKAQGGNITIEQDLNQKYCFFIYGSQYKISSKIPFNELLGITGDVNVLMKFGLMNGRKFDFPYKSMRYIFEQESVSEILGSADCPRSKIANVLGSIFIADLKIDRIALLDSEDVIIDIIDKSPLQETLENQNIAKYVVLRDDNTKEQFADIIEIILNGKSTGTLRRKYLLAESVSLVLPDQIPYYLKPLPRISVDELKYLRGLINQLKPYESTPGFNGYYAKDINYKLFGYGGCCSVCGFENKAINGFDTKRLKVSAMRDLNEQYFYLTLYLCADCLKNSSSWIIEELSVGGMTPFLWLEEIIGANVVLPEFMYAQIRFYEQVSYETLPFESEPNSEELVYTDSKTYNLTLSPLVMAKWIEDNDLQILN